MFIPSPGQRGFTLIEMLVVLLLMSMVAGIAVSSLSGNVNQQRFEDTQRKIKAIKHAILGYPERSVNNGPQISGFVADMGRLPNNLRELLVGGDYCEADSGISTEAACNAAGSTWIELPSYSYHSDGHLWSGWRGPYLDVMSDTSGNLRYPDGWGNGDDSDVNYGWAYSLEDSNTTLHLRSMGLNNIDDASTGDVYEDHYPLTSTDADKLIVKADFSHDIAVSAESSEYGVTVTMVNASSDPLPGSDVDLCAAIHYLENGQIKTKYSSSVVLGPTATIPLQVVANASLPIPFTFSSSTTADDIKLTAGYVSMSIWEDQGSGCNNGTIYKTDNNHPRVMIITPRSGLPTAFEWRVDG